MTGEYGNIIKLQWDAPAPTVVNVKKVYMVHPREIRNISLAEAAALQGFPPGYAWHGTDTQIAQMIANAMPAEMAAAVAGAIA
jgi:DNA (cytosine-5)-methyltransferase 1